MRKLKSEKRFREQRKKEKELTQSLRDNGMSDREIAEYMQVLAMSDMIETAANDVVAKKLKKLEATGTKEETTEEVQENV